MNDNFWLKTTVIIGPEGSMSPASLWLDSSGDIGDYAALCCYASGEALIAEECLIRNATTGAEMETAILQNLGVPLTGLYEDRRQGVLYANGGSSDAFTSSGLNFTSRELPVIFWAKSILSQQAAKLFVSTESGSVLGQWCLSQNIPFGDPFSIGVFNGFRQI